MCKSSQVLREFMYRHHSLYQFAHQVAKHPTLHKNCLRDPHRDSQQSSYVTDSDVCKENVEITHNIPLPARLLWRGTVEHNEHVQVDSQACYHNKCVKQRDVKDAAVFI